MKNTTTSMENLIQQLEGESSQNLPMCELLSLDKQLKNIRGSLNVGWHKKVELQQSIEKENFKLEENRRQFRIR